jgi:drug/metabolite transporter (DMT)-like permease
LPASAVAQSAKAEAQSAQVGLSTDLSAVAQSAKAEARSAKVGLSTEARSAKVDHVRLAYLAWITVCLLWGTTYLGIRVALETIPPATVGALRYLAAGGALAIILLLRGERLPGPRHWWGLTLLGFLMIGMGNGGVIWAEQWVPSGVAAVVVACSPFWMAGIESVLPNGERLSLRGAIGLVIGFLGILVLVWPDLTRGGDRGRLFAIGVVALQLACIGWALGSAYSRRHAREENALGTAAMQMLFGGLIMAIVATLRGEWTHLTFTWRSGAAEFYLIVLGSLVGYSAYVYALKHLPLSTVSLYAYVNPVIAVALGTVLLGEPFGWRVVVAPLVVFAGIAVVKMSGGAGRSLRTAKARAAA